MNIENIILEGCSEKKDTICLKSPSYIATKLRTNQIINGIKINELILVNSHFFVDVCI